MTRCALLTMATVLGGVSLPRGQAAQPHFDPVTARLHVGETATVCGEVAAASCGSDMTLTFAPIGLQPGIRAVVPLDVRAALGPRPEQRLTGRRVCVRGTIRLGRHFYEVPVRDVTSLSVAPESAEVAVTAFGADAYRQCDLPGLSMPRLRREVKPQYVGDAQQRKVEGVVQLEAVVGTNGRVTDVRVIGPLDRDLDAEAVRALGLWQFEPAVHHGRPVAIIVGIEMAFTLRR